MAVFLRAAWLNLLLLTGAVAQTFTISGKVTSPLTLNAANLSAMTQTHVTATDRDGKEHYYSGVALFDLLKSAGVTLGNELRGENLLKCVVVKAADGYEVLFALAEIDSSFTSRTIVLADRVDGQPLPAGQGPYRIVVPGEKKPTRWIRDVRAIDVRFAN